MASQPQYPHVLHSQTGLPALSPLRRQHVAQPPTLLTTSLNNAHSLGHGLGLTGGQTPLSTTSLSSPFSQQNLSPYQASPAGATPSMHTASPAAYAPTYNPQQWGRISGDGTTNLSSTSALTSAHARQSSRNINYAPRLRGPDEPMVSPPPPYTADPANPSPADTMSPATDFSRGTTPSSASTAFSPYVATASNEHWSPNTAYARTTSPAITQTTFAPPPSAAGRARSSSRTHTERFLTAMNLRPRNNTASPPNAIETLQHNTAQALVRTGQTYAEPVSPPAARRAASAGAIGDPYTARATFESPVQTERGFALPPPPPGPPPATTRSQSMNRVSATYTSPGTLAPPRARQPPGRGTGLDPVPPTPANWIDDDLGGNGNHGETEPEPLSTQPIWPREELHVDNESVTQSHSNDSQANIEATSNSSSSTHIRRDSGGLVRSTAVRNRSKGIRERRSESMQGRRQDSAESAGHAIVTDALSRPLQDIVISGKVDSLAGRRLSTRSTPKSEQFRGLDETLTSADLEPRSGKFISPKSTPLSATFRNGVFTSSSTPSFSPGQHNFNERGLGGSSESKVSSKPLPTTPLHLTGHGAASSSLTAPLPEDSRPISHILHMPNDDNVNIRVLPLSPESTQSLMDLEDPESSKSFVRRAAERHRSFLQKESEASSDSERLQLFVEHMIAESRIRRERYAQVFVDEKLDPADLLDGIFEEPESEDVEAHLAQLSRQASVSGSRPSSATSFADSHSHRTSRRASTTTSAEPPLLLTIDTSVNDPRRKDYVPVLSPIASMSAVTGRDETESRGRAPSRWWESQSNPSNTGDGFKVLERSKRESKYMSAVLENEASPSAATLYQNAASSSQLPMYALGRHGLNEYPPEKTGQHADQETPGIPPLPHPPTPMSAPFTPDPRKLDISRLITLPPPYPRHYPAVNNSHPDLADVRTVVRTLQDGSEQDHAKEAYESRFCEKRLRADSLTKHQKSLHDQDMQFRMEHGEISQEQFDEAEASLEAKLAQSAKDLAQADFDLYQSHVVGPLHALYTERINRASSAFSALSSRLHEDSRTHSPNLPQEAGDEQPELLERLTMLKWLFEAREALHRDLFNLLSARNDRYKSIVLLPISSSSTAADSAKLIDARAFFAKDALSRRAAADTAALARWESFQSTIESHATRGVEVQLSAFWDIAPPLQALLQRVPSDALRLRAGFEILIPRAEVDENLAYWAHPLRYLYSTLRHAEASSRQFVEGQVSLWCLVQEVREGCVGAKWRAEGSKRAKRDGEEGTVDGGGGDGEGEGSWRWQVEMCREEEVRMGVEDLKEKVAAVEGQWVEGLGGEIGRVKTGIRAFLEESGGWDDELEEGGE